MSFPAPNPFMCAFTTVFLCQIFLPRIFMSFNAIPDLFVFPGGQVGRIVVPRFWTRVGPPCHICPAQNATPATISWNQTKLVPIPYQKKYGYKEDRLKMSRPRHVWTTSTRTGSSYDSTLWCHLFQQWNWFHSQRWLTCRKAQPRYHSLDN